jgi:uncharacterized protein YkwD
MESIPNQLLVLHNGYRARKGKSPLSMSESLTQACYKHCEWMDNRNKLSHRGKFGSTHSQRARREGYEGFYIAENIAFLKGTAEDVIDLWMNSKGHKENILGDFRDFGAARIGDYWCTIFGR